MGENEEIKVCRAESDGDCYWDKCPQNKPATRKIFCELPWIDADGEY